MQNNITLKTINPFKTDFNFYYPYHGKKYLVEIKNGYAYVGKHWKEIKVYSDNSSTFNYTLNLLCNIQEKENNELIERINSVGHINPISDKELKEALKKTNNNEK